MDGISSQMDGTNGIFWVAGEEPRKLPGLLKLNGRWPRVEIFGALTPAFISTPDPSGDFVTSTPAIGGAEELTIHGNMAGLNNLITIFKASTRHRQMQPLRDGGPETHVLEGSFALTGAHVDGPDATYREFRFRVKNIDYWVDLNGLVLGANEDRSEVTLNYKTPMPREATLADEAGTVSFEAGMTLSNTGFSSASISSSVWVRITLKEGITVSELRNEYCMPISVLLALLYGEDCPLTALEVHNEDAGVWMQALVHEIEQDVDGRPDWPLIDLAKFRQYNVARWFSTFKDLSPIPQLVAGVIRQNGRTIENQLLDLAAAAEGLHRRLYRDSRRLSPEQVTNAMEKLDGAGLEEAAHDILRSALEIHLWDASFPQRLSQLADDVKNAAPGICGRSNRWKREVAAARNGFAHSLDKQGNIEQEAYKHYVLTQSIRWLITVRSLKELDLADDLIQSSLEAHEPYRQFLRNASEGLPYVYLAD